jgi:hypothetical protein
MLPLNPGTPISDNHAMYTPSEATKKDGSPWPLNMKEQFPVVMND